MPNQNQKKILSEEISFKNAQGCPASTVCHRSLDLDNRGNLARVRKSRWVKAEGFDGKFSEPDAVNASVKFPWNLSRRQIFLTIFKTRFPSEGFTLIETIIALAIITSAVVGPFSLATKGILHSSFAKNKIIAANLSQEGIELVRKIRENNILAGRDWDYGIASGSWQADIFSSDLSPFSGVPVLFDSATGIYSQTSGSQSSFTRKITITKPSANEISISSEVSWMERGIDRKVILSEKLYNWR